MKLFLKRSAPLYYILSLLLLLLLIPSTVQAQSTCTYGTVCSSLSTSSTGAVTGTAFAIPSSYANIITWTVVADGSALSANLECSVDNTTYFVVDSNTVAAGAVRNFGFTGIKFCRISQVSRTGGTITTGTIVTARGFINNGTLSGSSFTFTGQTKFADGTDAAPSIAFTSEPGLGFSRPVGAGNIAVNNFNAGGLRPALFTPSAFVLGSAISLGWSSTTAAAPAPDTTLVRSAAGQITLGPTAISTGSIRATANISTSINGAFSWNSETKSAIRSSADGVIELQNVAATDFSRLNFGGTTGAFPALKRSSNSLEVRLADDSGYTNFAVNGLQFTSNINRLGTLLISATAPSAPSACGTSPAITTSNGSAVFVVTGGTGGTATGCTVTMPAATNGWNCNVFNITQTAAHRADRDTRQTASSTTSVTFEYVIVSTGAATAFTASDVFRGICFAY